MIDCPVIKLKKDEDRRIRAGHLWIFSNEIDVASTPISTMPPGTMVAVNTHNGKFLAYGYLNPASLISIRILGRDQDYYPNESLLVHRIKIALSLRQRLFPLPYYRLIFGESDFLPGLVVDRYGDYLVVQITTAGMESLKDSVIAALEKVLHPKAILLRNDSSAREMEGLASYIESVVGEMPEEIELEDMGVKYRVSVLQGQKTGWFYDQRMNRKFLGDVVKNARVLDVFSYVGAWGIKAAVEGASAVVCVDASANALSYVQQNAQLNKVENKVSSLQGDAFDVMKGLRVDKEKFDVVIVDPPAFIKRKKDLRNGLEAYSRLNQLAIQLLEKDGILVSGSCSHHLSRHELQKLMLQSARHNDRNMQLIYQGYQGPDHPIHPAIPETEYLKAIFARVSMV
jgi:23S rRNA (cytosine1962-C5)-methyltransferase